MSVIDTSFGSIISGFRGKLSAAPMKIPRKIFSTIAYP
jgi:hypothetical protein